MNTEKTIRWLFLVSAVYLAPHTDKWIGIMLGALFCFLACCLWVAKIYKEWKIK